jgi:hypothetical protein
LDSYAVSFAEVSCCWGLLENSSFGFISYAFPICNSICVGGDFRETLIYCGPIQRVCQG